jgi:hypothetical protein
MRIIIYECDSVNCKATLKTKALAGYLSNEFAKKQQWKPCSFNINKECEVLWYCPNCSAVKDIIE